MQEDIRRQRSGQVMVEALVGLALIVFAWALVSVATFMANNHVRTLMAARHAAWQKGMGKTPSAEDIEAKFFFQGGLTKVECGTGFGIGDLISGTNAADLTEFADGGRGPYVAKVSFGLTAEDLNTTTTFPMNLMGMQFPLMPSPVMEEFLMVESHCQWDEVGETWSDWKKALDGVMDTLKGEISGFLRGLVDL